MFGLRDHDIERLHQIFDSHDSIQRVILYGSRAKGNYRPNSDIDLTLVGSDLDSRLLSILEQDLDDLLLPYQIDLSILSAIENPDLKDHIERVGQVLYERRI